MKTLILLALFSFLLVSCEKEEIVIPADHSRTYEPISKTSKGRVCPSPRRHVKLYKNKVR